MNARELIAEILRQTSLLPTRDIRLADIDGWDSLKGVRLVLRLEELVGRELSEEDIEKLQSLDDVDRLLSAT